MTRFLFPSRSPTHSLWWYLPPRCNLIPERTHSAQLMGITHRWPSRHIMHQQQPTSDANWRVRLRLLNWWHTHLLHTGKGLTCDVLQLRWSTLIKSQQKTLEIDLAATLVPWLINWPPEQLPAASRELEKEPALIPCLDRDEKLTFRASLKFQQ